MTISLYINEKDFFGNLLRIFPILGFESNSTGIWGQFGKDCEIELNAFIVLEELSPCLVLTPKEAFIEFKNYPCLYKDCNHDKEPECNLKKAVLAGQVLESRYENYLNFKKEFSERK